MPDKLIPKKSLLFKFLVGPVESEVLKSCLDLCTNTEFWQFPAVLDMETEDALKENNILAFWKIHY
jgi:hypothetical protein